MAHSGWSLLAAAFVGLAIWDTSIVRAGELEKAYFESTKPGSWAAYVLTSPDGSKSEFTYERQKDDAGRVVLEVRCKVLAGPGADSISKNIYFLTPGFDFARKGLSYGKFTEKLVMKYESIEMPADDATLKVIRESSKDFGGAVTFEGTEKIGGRVCDRYAYALAMDGPAPSKETGKLWLDASVPFAIVRQTGRLTGDDGRLLSSYEMELKETGVNQLIAESAATPAAREPEKLAKSSRVALSEGFKTGRVGLEIEADEAAAGRKLRVVLVNKTEAELTVDVPAGDANFEGDSPLSMLAITVPKPETVILPALEKSNPMVVGQRGKRGVTKGKCTLSVYEGTPLFSGSVTVDNLPK